MNRDDDGNVVSKARFVWLALEIARLDRETYRQLRATAWEETARLRFLDGKSENPN